MDVEVDYLGGCQRYDGCGVGVGIGRMEDWGGFRGV